MYKIYKRKNYLPIAFILFGIVIIMNFPFPHSALFGNNRASVFNIPIQTSEGLYYPGMISFCVLLASLYFLSKSLKKYHVRICILAIILSMITPSLLANLYQRTLATDIYAVLYIREESECNFEMKTEKILLGTCELLFENYRNEDVTFTVEFVEYLQLEGELPIESMMNEQNPQPITIKANERKIVKFVKGIDVSKIKDHIDSGGSSSVSIIIKSEERFRRL